jgi:hypothetical protein
MVLSLSKWFDEYEPPDEYAAARERATAALRAEAEGLAADKADRAEAAQVLRDMETLRAW